MALHTRTIRNLSIRMKAHARRLDSGAHEILQKKIHRVGKLADRVGDQKRNSRSTGAYFAR